MALPLLELFSREKKPPCCRVAFSRLGGLPAEHHEADRWHCGDGCGGRGQLHLQDAIVALRQELCAAHHRAYVPERAIGYRSAT
jgi:hypothetical protein